MLPHTGNSNEYLQHVLLKIRKKLFGNLHFPSIMSILSTSFKHSKLPNSIKIHVTLLQIVYICMTATGAQWLSGRVLDSRPKGSGFEPHRRHCVVVLEQDTFILA